ncbi:His-Xaa-Ser repeat protein HxsA2 [Castellaniella sp.]|uniref:His-Xaa-Ser repeat protein HxsA2 n=1 Tax=Castellaniella sp. TaxID=1955812 RepID=UPI0039C88216
MKKHPFLVSVATATAAISVGATASAKVQQPVEGPSGIQSKSENVQSSPGINNIRVYNLGKDLHSFLMKPSASGNLVAYHHSHYSHSSHSSHRSSY